MENRPFWQLLLLFLIINFAALGIGGILQNPGPMGDWYQALDKAPWTPPGWVFGAAWTSIMVCFSIFMAKLVQLKGISGVIGVFVLQFILNVAWNPIFFRFQQMGIALVVIIGLAVLMGYFLFAYRKEMKRYSLLVAPYFIWLLIATSLNLYALMNN